jgi:hypothetical protein
MVGHRAATRCGERSMTPRPDQYRKGFLVQDMGQGSHSAMGHDRRQPIFTKDAASGANHGTVGRALSSPIGSSRYLSGNGS